MATAAEVLTSTWEKINDSEFLLKPLSGIEFMAVGEHVRIDPKGNAILSAAAYRLVLEFGLLNWRNFRDAEGNEVYFDSSMAKNIDRLSFEDIKPIALCILAKSQIGDEAEKKSSPQSSSQET